MIFDFFMRRKERKRVKDAFSKAVSVDIVEEMLAQDKLSFPKPEERRIEFIVVVVQEGPVELVSKRFGELINLAIEQGALVELMPMPFVSFAYGAPLSSSDDFKKREVLVGEIARQFGTDVKVVHGSRVGYCGLFGADGKLMHYGFYIPGMLNFIGILAGMEFGQVREVQEGEAKA